MSLKHFTQSYVDAAFWSSTDESDESGGEPLDKNYSSSDLTSATRRQMELDCERFYEANEPIWTGHLDHPGADGVNDEDEYAGRDFWFSRNGHGAGFFDGGWDDEVADTLQDAARAFGEFHLQVSDLGGGGAVAIEGYPLSKEALETARSRGQRTIAGLGAGSADDAAATELQLFIDNDGDLYRSQTQSIHANAAKKVASGKYDPVLAVKLWRYLVDAGAKKYAKEFASPSDWSRMFNVPTRDLVASRMATEWYDEHQIQHGHGGTHGLGDTSLHDSDGFGAGLGMWNPRR